MAKKPATKPVKKDALREKLLKELKAIIPKLDKEGLTFLVEQSRIHLYNMQVDELNRIKQQVNNLGAGKKTANQKNVKTDSFRFDPTGAGYYLRSSMGGTMFSKKEMVQMIKISNGPGTASATGTRLYTWFVRERSDVLQTLKINDKFDSRLGTLALIIKKNFKLKKI